MDTLKIKYPRTPHLPWSEGATSDDAMLPNIDDFVGKKIVVTEKMDGENTSLYNDYQHARSINSRSGNRREWLVNFWNNIKHNIPAGWRICGESMQYKHSLAYSNLKSLFLGFSIWNENNECLDWGSTLEWFDLIGVASVPVIYIGMFDEETIRNIQIDRKIQEGYVVRIYENFNYCDFSSSVAKYVRKNHVTTDNHWRHSVPEYNKITNS